MSKIFGIQRSSNKIAVARASEPSVKLDPSFVQSATPALRRFNEFWELMETVQKHGYIRAAMSVVGRSAIGAWWSLRKHSEYGDSATERQRKRLMSFYMYQNRQWDNIRDYQNFAGKLMIGVQYLRFFGQCAYHIIRNKDGQPLGLDFLHGLVLPNVDSAGKFKTPAFVQFPSSTISDMVVFDNPRDIIYVTNPDWEGDPSGGTDMEALTTFTFPLDLYLMTAARDYLKNRDRPEVVYQLPQDISEDAFDEFVKEMSVRYAGPSNLGRSPIAIQGDFEIKELRPYPDSIPYQESRQDAREEELAVAGVNGAKLGIVDGLTNSNMREFRREFHETGLVPLFILVELGFYEQIHQREFNVNGWEFKFKSPDFLNAVERATVHMRYRQMGVLSSNEIRYDLGKSARTDEGGDFYVEPAGSPEKENDTGGNPGSPPEGRPVEPDDPAQVGEPDMGGDPIRGDQHDDEIREDMLGELRTWKRFALNRVSKGKKLRSFQSTVLPEFLLDALTERLQDVNSTEKVIEIFDQVMTDVESVFNE